MEKLTATGNTIASISQENLKLDHQIKRVLACKPILAIILKETVAECKGLSCEEIERCIEGEVSIDKIPVNPTELITGASQEDFLPGEGMVRYDIRTYLRLPGMPAPELSKILIDVEAQKDETPGYSIAVRGLFYCCRMISSQLGTEFTVQSSDKNKYQNIKKVYSIWICTDTSDKRRDSIEKYSLDKEMLFGHNDDDHRYDLLSAVIVNVGKNYNDHDTKSRMLNVLSVLVDDTMGAPKKLRLLKDRYDVPVTSEIKKEVEDMCTYTASVEAKGEARGEAKLAKLIECLMKANRNADIEKAVTNENERKKFYREFGMID